MHRYKVTKKRFKRYCKGCDFLGDIGKSTHGYGDANSGVFIIGEGPGFCELNEINPGNFYVDKSEEDPFYQIPFVGPFGGILNWALQKSGFIKDQYDRANKCYITNAVKCYPARGNMERYINKKKMDVEAYHVRKCVSNHLNVELKKGKPKFVLLLGKHAYGGFTGDYGASIEKNRGFWGWSDKHNCWYFATIHPAAVFRNGDKTSMFYRDIETFVDQVKSGQPPKIKLGKHYKTITTFPEARALYKKLKRKKRVAYDTETRNVRNYDKEWFALGMSWCWKTGHAAYVPLTKEGGRDFWPIKQQKKIVKWSKSILESRKIKKDGQNIKYDVNVCRKLGIEMHGIDWDTMQAHHLFDETTPSNLTFLTTWYRLNFPKYDESIKEYIGSYKSSRGTKEQDFSTVPIPIMGKYACADVDAVWRIRRIQKKAADKRIKTLYYTISTEMSKSAAEIEWNGALIDVGRIKQLEAEYDKDVEKVNRRLAKLARRKEFNVNSPVHMKEVLYGKEKGQFDLTSLNVLKGKLKKTKKGNWSTDKNMFIQIKRHVPESDELSTKKKARILKVLSLIEEVRKMRKMKSTYLTGFAKIVDPNNRVHTSYLTTGTVTGRYASEGPNLQNIPRDPIFRSLFIVGKGRKMLPADYSQIEARLIAWLAKEVQYIEQFADPNFDPHYYNSSIVRKKPISEITKEERSYDKAVTFGMNYGRSEESIAETYNLPLEFVQDFVRKYFGTLTKVRDWRKWQIKRSTTIRPNGTFYLETEAGRRRHFHAYEWYPENCPIMKWSVERERIIRNAKKKYDGVEWRPWGFNVLAGTMERQAINFPIQSYASDKLSLATAKVRKKLKEEKLDAFLVLSVHDMIAIDSSEKDVKRAAKILDEEMPFTEATVIKGKKVSLDFPVDYGVTDHWKQ